MEGLPMKRIRREAFVVHVLNREWSTTSTVEWNQKEIVQVGLEKSARMHLICKKKLPITVTQLRLFVPEPVDGVTRSAKETIDDMDLWEIVNATDRFVEEVLFKPYDLYAIVEFEGSDRRADYQDVVVKIVDEGDDRTPTYGLAIKLPRIVDTRRLEEVMLAYLGDTEHALLWEDGNEITATRTIRRKELDGGKCVVLRPMVFHKFGDLRAFPEIEMPPIGQLLGMFYKKGTQLRYFVGPGGRRYSFVPQERAMKFLEKKLWDDRKKVVALVGGTGSGKTSALYECAEATKVCYVSCRWDVMKRFAESARASAAGSDALKAVCKKLFAALRVHWWLAGEKRSNLWDFSGKGETLEKIMERLKEADVERICGMEDCGDVVVALDDAEELCGERNVVADVVKCWAELPVQVIAAGASEGVARACERVPEDVFVGFLRISNADDFLKTEIQTSVLGSFLDSGLARRIRKLGGRMRFVLGVVDNLLARNLPKRCLRSLESPIKDFAGAVDQAFGQTRSLINSIDEVGSTELFEFVFRRFFQPSVRPPALEERTRYINFFPIVSFHDRAVFGEMDEVIVQECIVFGDNRWKNVRDDYLTSFADYVLTEPSGAGKKCELGNMCSMFGQNGKCLKDFIDVEIPSACKKHYPEENVESCKVCQKFKMVNELLLSTSIRVDCMKIMSGNCEANAAYIAEKVLYEILSPDDNARVDGILWLTKRVAMTFAVKNSANVFRPEVVNDNTASSDVRMMYTTRSQNVKCIAARMCVENLVVDLCVRVHILIGKSTEHILESFFDEDTGDIMVFIHRKNLAKFFGEVPEALKSFFDYIDAHSN